MRIVHLYLLLGGFFGTCIGKNLDAVLDEIDSRRHPRLSFSLTAPTIARKLGVGLAPTEVPYEPPGFKPTTTPTDRTKKPTFPPSPKPTSPIPTRSPTAPYPCALCRPTEEVTNAMQQILWQGSLATCQYVESLGDLEKIVGSENCQFYRDLGQYTCLCKPKTVSKKPTRKPSRNPTKKQ
jgi:hypothetical protein